MIGNNTLSNAEVEVCADTLRLEQANGPPPSLSTSVYPNLRYRDWASCNQKAAFQIWNPAVVGNGGSEMSRQIYRGAMHNSPAAHRTYGLISYGKITPVIATLQTKHKPYLRCIGPLILLHV